MSCNIAIASSPPPAPSSSSPISSSPDVTQRPRPARTPRSEILEAIYRSAPHRFWLEHNRGEEESFNYIVDSQEEVCRIRVNELYQLLGMFAVFQGVVFSAVSQSTILSCKDVWSPVSLSLTASVATVLAVIQKLASIDSLKEEVQKFKARANAVYGEMELMKLKGLDFDFNPGPDIGTTAVNNEGLHTTAVNNKGLRRAFSGYGITLMAILLIFSVGIMVSCAIVLCRECKCDDSAAAPV